MPHDDSCVSERVILARVSESKESKSSFLRKEGCQSRAVAGRTLFGNHRASCQGDVTEMKAIAAGSKNG